MNILCDYHAHTNLIDGANTVEEMVKAAYEKGCRYFGLSDHLYEAGLDFGSKGETLDKYIESIERLKVEYRGKMDVFCGLECEDYDAHLFLTDYAREHTDYLIKSTHIIYPPSGKVRNLGGAKDVLEDLCANEYGGSWEAFLKDYYVNFAAKMDSRINYTFIAHFDILTKHNTGNKHFDTGSDMYREYALYALHELAKAGLPFEINTGAMNRGQKTYPYPEEFLLKELHSLGARIIINSDAHCAEHICGNFEKAAQDAYDCGFRKRTIITPEGLKEIDL